MKFSQMSAVIATVAAATIVEGVRVANPAAAVSLTGLDIRNNLLFFDSNTPSTVTGRVAVSGLQTGEALLGIDYRPATGGLFGIGSSSQVYSINPTTGAATAIGGAPFTPGLNGNAFGFDFNPVPDLIRVVSNTGQNLRLSPNTGAQAANSPDAVLNYAAGDVNVGQPPSIVATAYTNNVAGTTSTTLYGIDPVLDVLVRQGGLNFPANAPSPNTGQLFTVGALGVNFSNLSGFDIFTANGNNTAFASDNASLYTIDLNTGAAALIGTVGDGTPLRGLAAEAVPEPLTMMGYLAGSGGLAWLRRRSKLAK